MSCELPRVRGHRDDFAGDASVLNGRTPRLQLAILVLGARAPERGRPDEDLLAGVGVRPPSAHLVQASGSGVAVEDEDPVAQQVGGNAETQGLRSRRLRAMARCVPKSLCNLLRAHFCPKGVAEVAHRGEFVRRPRMRTWARRGVCARTSIGQGAHRQGLATSRCCRHNQTCCGPERPPVTPPNHLEPPHYVFPPSNAQPFATPSFVHNVRASTMLSSMLQYVHPPYRPRVCTPCAANSAFSRAVSASERLVMCT